MKRDRPFKPENKRSAVISISAPFDICMLFDMACRDRNYTRTELGREIIKQWLAGNGYTLNMLETNEETT